MPDRSERKASEAEARISFPNFRNAVSADGSMASKRSNLVARGSASGTVVASQHNPLSCRRVWPGAACRKSGKFWSRTARRSPSGSFAPRTSSGSGRSRSSPRRTSSRCTASRPTRPTRSAAARISSGRSGRSRRISRSPKSCASRSARRRRRPSRLRPPLREPGIRRGLRGRRHHLHRPLARHHAQARQQGRRARARRRGRRAGHAGDRPAPRRSGGVAAARRAIGYPVMLKASWGGGGRGMRVIRDEAALVRDVTEAKREAKAAFGKDEVYLEKLVERARHVEVQILGDTHGNRVHLFERDCSIQRRHQKVVERAPAPYLDAGAAGGALRLRAEDRRCRQLRLRRHGRVPAGRRHRQLLLHRGQSAHPGRAHRHRGGDRHRHRQGADPHDRGEGASATRIPACRRRTRSG